MQWFTDLSMRWKIALPLTVILAVFLTTASMNRANQQQTSIHSKEISGRYLVQIRLVLEADRDLYQALVAEKAMVFEDVTDALLDDYSSNIQQAKDRTLKAIALLKDNAMVDEQHFLQQWQAWHKISQRVIELKRNGETVPAVALHKTESQEAFQSVRNILDELTERQTKQAEAMSQLLDDDNTHANKLHWIMLITMVSIFTLTLIILPGYIQRPLQQMQSRLYDIANGDGDLRPRLALERKDEIGQLATQIDLFMGKLQQLVKNIKLASEEVTHSSDDMAQQAEGSKTISDRQREAIRVVVAAMTEIGESIREIANRTALAAERTKEADQISQQSLATLNLAITNVQNLATELETTSTMIGELEEHAANATSVLDVIRAIAEQTNLLALNAAIEAARAGEQGRGFAVVADEVRTLASRTQDSTSNIQHTLEALQSRVTSAVAAINASTQTVSNTVTSAEEAGKGIVSISAAISEITGMTLQIAATSEQQSQVMHEINNHVADINDQATAGQSAAEKNAAASRHLRAVSLKLADNINSFKV